MIEFHEISEHDQRGNYGWQKFLGYDIAVLIRGYLKLWFCECLADTAVFCLPGIEV